MSQEVLFYSASWHYPGDCLELLKVHWDPHNKVFHLDDMPFFVTSWLPIYESFQSFAQQTLWKGFYGIHLCRCKYPSDAFLNALHDKTMDATWMWKHFWEGNRLGAKDIGRAWLLQLHPQKLTCPLKKGPL